MRRCQIWIQADGFLKSGLLCLRPIEVLQHVAELQVELSRTGLQFQGSLKFGLCLLKITQFRQNLAMLEMELWVSWMHSGGPVQQVLRLGEGVAFSKNPGQSQLNIF